MYDACVILWCEGHGQLDLPRELDRSFMSHVTCARGIGLVTSEQHCSRRTNYPIRDFPCAVPGDPEGIGGILELLSLGIFHEFNAYF